MRKSKCLVVVAAAAAGGLLAGCAGLNDLSALDSILPGVRTITVEIVNDTSFDVDPHILFDDDDGSFDAFVAGLLGTGSELETGLVESGALVQYDFDCDELGLIFSDEAEQVALAWSIGVAEATDVLRRGEEFNCGDLIRFRFVGSAGNFGVIVSVNGQIVD